MAGGNDQRQLGACPVPLSRGVRRALQPGEPAPGATYIGRENQLQVRIPRVEGERRPSTIDGALDEPAWREAAVLTGFSQFSPLDGVPAADSTQVLIWYSPTALYVGIRAFEAHGAVHATLADRDKITADDNVQLLLGTFHDRRQAYVFAVNPFGVQMDGTIVEAGRRHERRLDADAVRARRARSQPGLRLHVQGTADGVRVRGRDPHSVQESQISIR